MRLTCGKCDNGWICEEHPDLPWPHDDCGGPGVPCENPACDFSIIATGRSKHRGYDTKPDELADERQTIVIQVAHRFVFQLSDRPTRWRSPDADTTHRVNVCVICPRSARGHAGALSPSGPRTSSLGHMYWAVRVRLDVIYAMIMKLCHQRRSWEASSCWCCWL